MAISPYGGPRARNSRYGLWAIEACLALSVIAGLLFVTLRVMNMPEITPQPSDTAVVTTDVPPATIDAAPAAPDTVVVTTAGPDAPGTKTQ